MKKLSPAQRNRQLLEELSHNMPKDEMAVCVFVSPEYERFVSTWAECVNLAYPKYQAVVIRKDDTDKNRMAAMRFTDGEDVLGDYPYVLITDVDMLIMKETPSILYQHLFWMKKHGLECYSNSIVDNIRFSGVHFITRDWWAKTRPARERARAEILKTGCAWGDDEKVLAKIIIESGLNVTKDQMLWNHHGIHLGAYKRAKTFNVTGSQSSFLSDFLSRKGFGPEHTFPDTLACLKAISDSLN